MTRRSWLLAVLVTAMAFALTACGSTTTTADELGYEDFDYIDSFAQIWTRRDPGGDYIVYLYSTSCATCEDIKDEMFAFAQNYTARHVYFFDITGYQTSDPDVAQNFVAVTGITQLYYPALLLVEDQGFDPTAQNRYFYSGKTRILPILYDLEQGVFTFGD
ncbi:MAG TPA: hypothetical protein P5154_06775 [Candidatus Izemoplasmatales bacterium]|nr:hypothetical protein [Candidatus Izemoplasmatales bacterium]